MIDALYELDQDRFVPTAHTTGPWDPRAQHGGAPAALLARAVEAVEAPTAMQLARLTVELLRPVPLEPLTVATSVVRSGRKVQLVAAALHARDVEVVRATALRIRVAELDVPPDAAPYDAPPPGPEHGEELVFPVDVAPGEAFHRTGCQLRFVAGGFDRPGPATAWIRLAVPVVAGEAPSPAQRVAAAADFGNGVSWVLPPELGVTFINPDLTVHLSRLPVGEWIALDATTHPTDRAVGLAESALYDRDGRIGRSVQSLLFDRVPG